MSSIDLDTKISMAIIANECVSTFLAISIALAITTSFIAIPIAIGLFLGFSLIGIGIISSFLFDCCEKEPIDTTSEYKPTFHPVKKKDKKKAVEINDYRQPITPSNNNINRDPQ